jgi:hypothetical protein
MPLVTFDDLFGARALMHHHGMHHTLAPRPRRMPAALTAAVLLMLGACSTAAPSADPPAPAKTAPRAAPQAAALRQQLTELIGDARCTDDTQCRTLPLGAKACGGPEAWLAWSTLQTQEEPLVSLGKQFADARRTEVQKQGLLSNCMMVVDPGAQCVASRCVLRRVERSPQVQ